MKIKITETHITWRQKVIEDYVFMVQVVEDGAFTFSQKYTNAVEAVNAYNKFIDHGTCRYQREVVLVEPSGKAHAKVFEYPGAFAIR
jgi:hypothetical protein